MDTKKQKSYQYKAFNKQGFLVKGLASAVSKQDLYSTLAENELSLIKCRLNSNISSIVFSRKSKFTSHELQDFCLHMQYMDQAGVPLIDALEDAKVSQPKFSWVIEDMIDRIRKGQMLSQSINAHPDIFPKIFYHILRLSEESGQLAKGFEKIHDHLKWKEQYKKDLLQAVRYPSIVLGLSVVLIWFLSTYVVPQLQDLIQLSGTEIPYSSVFLLEATKAFSFWAPILILFIFIVFAISFAGRYISFSFRILIDKLILKIPFFGDLLLTRETLLYLHILQVSLSSGIDLLEALEYSLSSIKNSWLHTRLKQLCIEIREGKTLSEAFKNSEVFDVSTIRLIKVGELTGHLQPLLINLEVYQMKRYKGKMGKFISFIQPIIFAIAGLLLLWVVISAFYPMYDFVLDMTA